MSITYNDLISRAEQVRDESEIGANTATRVGQLLADIIQWCQDNNADLGDYLLNFTAHLNESGGILNWFQSRIVLLKTMGGAYDDVSVGSLSDGDVYYDSQGNWIREKQGSTTINGIHPSKGVFYVNLANKTAYQWDGTTFQVAIESGGGGGASTVTAFEGYEVVASVGDLPEQGNPTTGYIVGTHIYAYVGENGDTADGKYQDLGALEAAGVSVTTAEDGTFTIHAGGNDYTVNLNHSHPNMCKLVVCEESDLPSTLDNDTIYAITDSGETEIEKLIIRGMEFVGGGGVDDTPRLTSPRSGLVIDFNESSTKTLMVKGINLTSALTVAKTGDFTVTANGQSVSSISASDAINGVQLTLTKGNNFTGGTLAISSDELEEVYSVVDWYEIDLSQASSIDGWPGGSGFSFLSTQKSRYLAVSGFSKIRVTANSVNSAYLLLLKSSPASWPSGSNYDYTNDLATGETGRRVITKEATEIITLPSDCAYILAGQLSSASSQSSLPTTFEVK